MGRSRVRAAAALSVVLSLSVSAGLVPIGVALVATPAAAQSTVPSGVIPPEGTAELISGPVGGAPASGHAGNELDVSSDGSVVVYRNQSGGIHARLRPSGGAASTVLVTSNGRHPSISPNGQWISFMRPLSGQPNYDMYRYEVSTGATVKVSAGRPAWGTYSQGAEAQVADSGRVFWVEDWYNPNVPSPPAALDVGCPRTDFVGVLFWSDGSGVSWHENLIYCDAAIYVSVDASGERVAIGGGLPREDVWEWPEGAYLDRPTVVYSMSTFEALAGSPRGDKPRLSGNGHWMFGTETRNGSLDDDHHLLFMPVSDGVTRGFNGQNGDQGEFVPECWSHDVSHDADVVLCETSPPNVLGYGDLALFSRHSGVMQRIAEKDTYPVKGALSGDGRTIAYYRGGSIYVRTSSVVDLPHPPSNGTGDFDDSAWYGPNPAVPYDCPCQGWTEMSASTRSGFEHTRLPGLSVPGRGPGLAFGLAFNSPKAGVASPVGAGWDFSYGMTLTEDPGGTVTVKQETGSTVTFYPDGLGGWYAPRHVRATLTEGPGGSWELLRNHFEHFGFDASGRLVRVEDGNGEGVDLDYSGSSSLVDSVEDGAGRQLDFAWSSGLLQSVTDTTPSGDGGPRSVSLGYSSGRLTSYTDTSGGVWTMGYDGAGRLASRVSPRNQVTGAAFEWHYDSSGRLDWEEDELNRRTTLQYDTPVAGATTVTAPDGDVQIDWYTDGQRRKVTHAAGTADEHDEQFIYDPSTLAVLEHTDGRGKRSTFDYDLAGNRTYAKDPLGREVSSTFNDLGQPSTVTANQALPGQTAVNVITTYDYDGAGNLESVTADDGGAAEATTTYVYSDPGHPGDVTEVVDARGKTWSYDYLPTRGDLIRAEDPTGRVTTWVTDSLGRTTSSVSPRGNASGGTPAQHESTATYDDRGLVLSETDPLGNLTRYGYDADGNLETVETDLGPGDTDPEISRTVYDAAGQVSEVQQQSRVGSTTTTVSSTTYGYRADGAREWWENDLGGRWSYGWDHAGRLASETDPNGKVTGYAYDDTGNLVSITHPDAGATCTGTRVDCTTFTYDDAGQLTAVDHADAATPDVTGITYDGMGRRRNAVVAGVTEIWTWDRLGRLTSSKDRNGRTTGYGWNDTGQLTSITYPGLTTPLTRGYDDAGRWTSVTDWDGRQTTFGYDADSNWSTTTFPTASGNVDNRTYDRADRLTGITWKRGSQSVGTLTYTPNNDSLIQTIASGGAAGTGTKTYGYNARDELTGVGPTPITVDTAGNVTETEDGRLQIFDPAQQLCWSSLTATSGGCTTPSDDATRYTYDARGNRTVADPAIGASATYGWDEANRLATATVASDNPQAGQYRPLTGARVADTRSATATGTCNGTTCSTLAASTSTTVQVTGQAGVPATGVAAVVATVTATGASSTGTMRINPAGATSAAASVGFASGRDESTFVIAPVDANGRITLLADVAIDAVVDVAGYYTSAPDDGAGYHPRTTALLANTATGQGICDGVACSTATTAPATRHVKVAGRSGVPASGVEAAALRLSITAPTADGTLTVADQNGDTIGTISYETGRDASDVVIAPLAPDGTVAVTTTTTDDVRIDVSGWFTAPEADPGASLTTTIAPHRAHNGALAADARATITVAGVGGVPADADTVVVSVTASGTTTTGQVRIGPSGTTGGGTSAAAVSRYYPPIPADTVAIVPVRPDGTIQIYSSRAVNLTVDITAYTRPATETWTYSYDSTGLRTAKAENGISSSRLEFTWDRSGSIPLLLSQHEANGDVIRIIYGPGLTPLAQIDPDGTTRWLHTDHLGTVRLATSTTGTETSRHTYTTSGTPTVDTTGTAPHLLLGYAGEYRDLETGLIYLRARYMDATTGQFTSRDPVVSATGEPYSYASDNPVNNADPSGLWCVGRLCSDSVSKGLGAVSTLLEPFPDLPCLAGENGDGSCRLARGVEMYADDASTVLSVIGGACAAVALAEVGLNAAADACAIAGTVGSLGASTLHTAVTCKDLDQYCVNSAKATGLNFSMAGLGAAAFRGAPGVYSAASKAGLSPGLMAWCAAAMGNGIFGPSLQFQLTNTKERPAGN